MKANLFFAALVAGATGTVNAQEAIHATDIMNRREVDNRAVYFADEIKLEKNQTIVVDEPATIYTNRLKMDPGSFIDTLGNDLDVLVIDEVESDGGMIDVSYEVNHDTSGQDGPSGVDGVKAMDALKGGAGVDGSSASSGVNGGDAASISIITPVLKGNVTLMARGGNGGKGGNGGDGGRGGDGLSGMDARTLYNFKGLTNLPIDTLIGIGTTIGVPYVGAVLVILQIFNGLRIGDGFDGFDGGKGGNGGAAGAGGNGGNGGDIELIFGEQIKGTKILVSTRGGYAGSAGRPGIGGVGGVGGAGGQRGDLWSREGKPGKSGAAGLMGTTALAGVPGKSGKVKAIETGDPEWVKCYVRYRQVLDLSDDRELAKEILRSCS